jgi:branched-chain amino acid transport system substrate-binding protein
VAALLPVAACSNGGDGGSSVPSTIVTTTTTVVDDGALVIGAVLPASGAAPDIGGSLRTAVDLAMKEINDAGGVLGRPVRLITRDEGNDPATAGMAVQDLVQQGADAIVGPTSSLDVLGTLGAAVESGVLTCSPTASAMSLDAFPDNDLFFRTVPSDSLQAQALARVVEDSGSNAAVVVYLDDAYGRPFADATQSALRTRGTTVTESFAFSPEDTSIADVARSVAALRPQTVVVLADSTAGPSVITAIDEASTASRPTYVVNDAIRRPDSSVLPFNRSLARRITGVAPLAYPRNSSFTDELRAITPDTSGLFAENAYDCVNLIALAAQSSRSSLSADIAAAVPAVSGGGSSCADFAACNAVIADHRNPDYDGHDGIITLDSNGNTTAAIFEQFGFDDTGRDVVQGTVSIGAG